MEPSGARLYTAPQDHDAGPAKDHEVREVINAVTRVAEAFHGAQQLRERIACILRPLLKRESADLMVLIRHATTGACNKVGGE